MDKVFLDEYAGAKFRSIEPNEYSVLYSINSLDSYNKDIYMYPPQKTVTTTGVVYYYSENIIYLQIAENPMLCIELNRNDMEWQGISKSTKTYTQAQAQDLVNGIIRNNQYILDNNLLCARFANKLSLDQRRMLYALQDRLKKRDAALREGEVFSQMGEGYPEGYSEFGAELEAFMNNPRIGIAVSGMAIIIISAIVVASLSTAAYFAYQAYYKESEQDVKYSRELTEALQAKLTEEEYQQLLQETAGLLTKQRIAQQIASLGGNIKNLLLVGLGLLVALRAPKWIDAAQKAPVRTKKK